jgi:flagella basal body P-ring formation protein FlgA
MRISIVDEPRPTPFFDCRSEAGRRLMRCLGVAAAAALGVSLLLSGLGTEEAIGAELRPTLRSSVTVSSDLVTVGDFFENPGPLAGTPLFRSPDLGTTGAVPARRVIELARDAGVAEADTGGVIEVTVSRRSRTVEADELARLIATAALHRPGVVAEDTGIDDLRVVFDGTIAPIQADSRASVPARVASLAVSGQTGRFDALMLIDRGETTERMQLRGEIVETTLVLTPTRPLARGDVVGRDDIRIERVPRRTAGNHRPVEPSEIIGLAARRPLRPGQAIVGADFTRPNVVARGDLVTVLFQTENLVVTGRAQAQDAGAVGEAISVINQQSKRTLHATILGPGRVAVVAPGASLASLVKVNP